MHDEQSWLRRWLRSTRSVLCWPPHPLAQGLGRGEDADGRERVQMSQSRTLGMHALKPCSTLWRACFSVSKRDDSRRDTLCADCRSLANAEPIVHSSVSATELGASVRAVYIHSFTHYYARTSPPTREWLHWLRLCSVRFA